MKARETLSCLGPLWPRSEVAVISSAVAPGRPSRVSPLIRRIIAPNPGPFTFTGTCSYIVGSGEVAIIDPGPADPRHIEALLDALRGESLRYVLVTHTHRDHSPAAQALKAATGARVAGCAPHRPRAGPPKGLCFDAAHDASYAPDIVLAEGDRIDLGAVSLETIETPGHTANHLCFALAEERALFTGDHVMGWATTVIAPPDGSMRDYMASIERLRARSDRVYWPAHGEPIKDPQPYLRALLHHRRAREAAILQRLEAGDTKIAQIVARIYESVDPRLHGAAAMTVFAHLEDLVARGLAESDGPLDFDARFLKI